MNLTKKKRATFTPGPWHAYQSRKDVHRNIVSHYGSMIAREVYHTNARLIAAAPAMYDMCNLLLPIMQSIADDGHVYGNAESRKGELADKLREILAKVEGGEG